MSSLNSLPFAFPGYKCEPKLCGRTCTRSQSLSRPSPSPSPLPFPVPSSFSLIFLPGVSFSPSFPPLFFPLKENRWSLFSLLARLAPQTCSFGTRSMVAVVVVVVGMVGGRGLHYLGTTGHTLTHHCLAQPPSTTPPYLVGRPAKSLGLRSGGSRSSRLSRRAPPIRHTRASSSRVTRTSSFTPRYGSHKSAFCPCLAPVEACLSAISKG